MLKFHAQILCSDSVLPVLSLPSSLDHYFLSIFHLAYIIQCAQRTGLSYPIVHSALRYITSWAQRTALYYLLGTAHCAILPLGHSAVRYITSWAYRSALYYLSYDHFSWQQFLSAACRHLKNKVIS